MLPIVKHLLKYKKTYLVAPRPTLWGKIVAPNTLLWPWTESHMCIIGIPRRDSKAAFCEVSTKSAQPVAEAGSVG
jgi:hypothetical protein